MAKPKPVFTLGGKPFNLNGVGGVKQAIPRYLDKLPRGTLLKTKELAAVLGFSSETLTDGRAATPGYYVMYTKQLLWGSKQTIADAEAILGDNN